MAQPNPNNTLLALIQAISAQKSRDKELQMKKNLMKMQMMPKLIQSQRQMALASARAGQKRQALRYRQQAQMLGSEFKQSLLGLQGKKAKATQDINNFVRSNKPENYGGWGVSGIGLQNLISDASPIGMLGAVAGFGYGGLPNLPTRANRAGRKARGWRGDQIADAEKLKNFKGRGKKKALAQREKLLNQTEKFKKIRAKGARGAKYNRGAKKFARGAGWAGLGITLAGLGNTIYNKLSNKSPQKVVESANNAFEKLSKQTGGFKYFQPDMLNQYDKETGLTYRDLFKTYEHIAQSQDWPGQDLIGHIKQIANKAKNAFGDVPGQKRRELSMDRIRELRDLQSGMLSPQLNTNAMDNYEGFIANQLRNY